MQDYGLLRLTPRNDGETQASMAKVFNPLSCNIKKLLAYLLLSLKPTH